ncbi:hypothetical protein B0A52_07509 [Exophiala mesophila]|uniref:Uncharacterized protein n=1 Tax=Exophiala mesophila TaxID=212818 RepID=A0A438MYN7_EXOME|nr:hypothetical protein B0A52_07509 [Exophiala mesophila]
MPPIAANYIAYTAPVNPANASPVLTTSQIWKALEKKVGAGQDFVGGAITATTVLSTSTTPEGNPVTEREVTFRDGNRVVHETCISFEPMKVEFIQPDGSKVQNVVSQGRGGEHDLYLTYTFEWLHEGATPDELAVFREKEWKVAIMAVEKTIEVIRAMVKDGKIQ